MYVCIITSICVYSVYNNNIMNKHNEHSDSNSNSNDNNNHMFVYMYVLYTYITSIMIIVIIIIVIMAGPPRAGEHRDPGGIIIIIGFVLSLLSL